MPNAMHIYYSPFCFSWRKLISLKVEQEISQWDNVGIINKSRIATEDVDSDFLCGISFFIFIFQKSIFHEV